MGLQWVLMAFNFKSRACCCVQALLPAESASFVAGAIDEHLAGNTPLEPIVPGFELRAHDP